ncbi:hypothetical protein [Streptomyces spinosus]|uniref:hypothetical protein n=1 Tax=Streptomyces spinosus TaxID=2872623 RepID=UPI003555DAD8
MRGERPHLPLSSVAGRQRQVPRQLPVAPTVEHRLEDLFLRPRQRYPVGQVEPHGPRWDDVAVNVEAARAAGMRAYLFEDNIGTITRIAAHLDAGPLTPAHVPLG